ncbi:MAG: SAM-dependent methyltransferase [Chloracidobacterium sp.]|nr:SAM-dependent methyltransferase [Chloracidobacterium sp.]
MPIEIENFIAELQKSFASGTFIKLTLSNYKGAEHQLQRVSVRPVELKKGPRLMFHYRFHNRDAVKNFDTEKAVAEVRRLFDPGFRSGHLFAADLDIQLTVGKRNARLVKGRPSMQAAPVRAHDRAKKTFVDLNSPFLKALGVTTEVRKRGVGEKGDGVVVRADQRDKWKQINKFIEIVDRLIENSLLKDKPDLKIVDMGSGKGYLTFALYEYLRRIDREEGPDSGGNASVNERALGDSRDSTLLYSHVSDRKVDVTGVEQRTELVSLCNDLAKSCGFDGLHFRQGTIADTEIEKVDILIALHACDTATDDALYKGIMADAEIIIAAPCCHHEIKKQLKPPELLAPILKHPVMHERISETITDGIRSMLLEAHGYKTKMFEFVATEHTPKNNLIVATRREDNGEEVVKDDRPPTSRLGIPSLAI